MPEKDSEGFYSRTEAVIGKEAVERLKNSKIIIFGESSNISGSSGPTSRSHSSSYRYPQSAS